MCGVFRTDNIGMTCLTCIGSRTMIYFVMYVNATNMTFFINIRCNCMSCIIPTSIMFTPIITCKDGVAKNRIILRSLQEMLLVLPPLTPRTINSQTRVRCFWSLLVVFTRLKPDHWLILSFHQHNFFYKIKKSMVLKICWYGKHDLKFTQNGSICAIITVCMLTKWCCAKLSVTSTPRVVGNQHQHRSHKLSQINLSVY